MWIKRDISNILLKNSDFVQVVIGPRQCGKSSLLNHLGHDYYELSMDDLSVRSLAQRDAALLLSAANGRPVLIDEAQMAPEIFYAVKRQVDLLKRSGFGRQTMFRLTGSNQILMDKNVKESLAGRASYYEMSPLSVHEITSTTPCSVASILYQGGWPEIYANPQVRATEFLDNYIVSTIEKDIMATVGILKTRHFLQFCRLLAARVGTLLNASEVGQEVGVEQSTIRDWISVLERMKVIGLVPPYATNLSSRLVKRSKVYFLDTGLASRLQGWSDAGTLLVSQSAGPMFENLVFTEIYKTMKNNSKSWQIFHWRSRDGEEIDFLITGENKKQLLVEVKKSPQNPPDHSKYPEIRKVFKNQIPPLVLCHMEGAYPHSAVTNIAGLSERLLAAL